MNFLRELVSGKKQRYKDPHYNLDLTYITSRIIVMSYPASGLETLYRNPIKQVALFLRERHKGKYRVVNLSGRKYDESKFDNNVWGSSYGQFYFIC
jgi:phosphatidylinositol-3,4,5-trisphosphate 3-phosphatase/dual-specificity protein phosphatase PTEN